MCSPFEGKLTAMDDGQITSQWNNFGFFALRLELITNKEYEGM